MGLECRSGSGMGAGRGRTLSSSPHPQEGMMKRRMKMERKGKQLHLPIPYHLRTFPRLVTSLVGKRGSLLAYAGRNNPGRRLSH
jgi:hypothetical protein